MEAEHRDHAVVEQVIADLKDQALAHFPSGQFNANAAWTVLAALAHNLLRWTQLLGLPDTIVRAARTLRRRLLRIPGRLTRHARGWTLHLPARWPWHGDYTARSTASARSPPPPDRARAPHRHQPHRPGAPAAITAARQHPQPPPRQRRSPPITADPPTNAPMRTARHPAAPGSAHPARRSVDSV